MNTWMLNLQNSNSPLFDTMIIFHDLTTMILIYITTLIFYLMLTLFKNLLTNRFLIRDHTLELIWTLIPIFTLMVIAMPSIKILYLSDETHFSNMTLKSIGHQWYWSYEYSDFKNINFNSFMILTSNLTLNEFRLLDVDNRCILPFNVSIRILTTSLDVIHSWTIPSLGVKMDSTPGRLNQSWMLLHRPGLYFGQCSEICGINHSFMPIVIESTNFIGFKNWLKNN